MDKGKKPTAMGSGAMWQSANEKFEIESDSDEERGKAASKGPARGVGEGEGDSSSGTGAVGASSSSAPAAAQAVAPFEDGSFVRLRNRGRGGYYLFANEDGRGVTIDRRRGMVNTAWAVEVLNTRVLLRGAYGRYLSATTTPARSGHIGGDVTQTMVEFSNDNHHIEWMVLGRERGSVVLVRNLDRAACALRANGRYRRWNKGVTLGGINPLSISSMMEWEVQVIPVTEERPPYQLRPPNAAIQWPEGCQEVASITFTHAWVGDNGRVEHGEWIQMQFNGRSLTGLGNEIASRLGNGVQFENMTLYVQAGDLGLPFPLLTDLPLVDDPIIISVFIADSPGYIIFPDLAAE